MKPKKQMKQGLYRSTVEDRVNKIAGNYNGGDARLELIKEAITDELFLADLREVMDDFQHVDSEAA